MATAHILSDYNDLVRKSVLDPSIYSSSDLWIGSVLSTAFPILIDVSIRLGDGFQGFLIFPEWKPSQIFPPPIRHLRLSGFRLLDSRSPPEPGGVFPTR